MVFQLVSYNFSGVGRIWNSRISPHNSAVQVIVYTLGSIGLGDNFKRTLNSYTHTHIHAPIRTLTYACASSLEIIISNPEYRSVYDTVTRPDIGSATPSSR